ncbi:MAG: methylated-DNA--[protein]-cysteine S-methyltransferase [Acidimicrobiales bacterium]
MTRYRTVDSPVGLLTLAGQGGCLTNLVMEDTAHPPSDRSRWVEDAAAFPDVVAQLAAYFAGERTGFDVALRPAGTSFQQRVWDALPEIPYGETRSYGEIARRIGQPGAARAVGLANGRNPIAVIVPCHRVIGANGALTGYAGGLQAKRALLDLEQARRPGARRTRPALGAAIASARSRDARVARRIP